MKAIWLSIFLLPLVGLLSHEHEELELTKFYIDAQDIAFENSAIMVYTENEWSKVDSLFSNEKGFFILRSKKDSNILTYECWYCKYPIPFYRGVCSRCGLSQ